MSKKHTPSFVRSCVGMQTETNPSQGMGSHAGAWEPETVPSLRFPEFRDAGAWVNSGFYDLLEDVLDFRGRTPKKLGMDWGGGNIVSLSANNVKNGYIDFDAECNLGGDTLYQKWMSDVNLEKGDIVFTMEAPLGNALLVPDTSKYILSQRVVAFKPKNNVNNTFLIQLIWSDSFQKTINLLSTGSTAKGINQKTLKTVNVLIPAEKEEQQKIADCLSSIDDLITAQAKKIETLKAHKKGLMQQLFPREGETVPGIRFPEFRDAEEWKIKPFDKLFTIGNGKDHKHLLSGDVPVYGSGGYMRSVNECLYDGESACIGRKGTINNPIFLTEKFWTVDTLFYTHSFKECLPKFIYLIFQNINWLKHNEAGGVPSLSKANIVKIEVAVPKPNEQQKIANCLSSIDDLITVQAQKIEALKAHKKGLMQQIFPSSDEVGT